MGVGRLFGIMMMRRPRSEHINSRFTAIIKWIQNECVFSFVDPETLAFESIPWLRCLPYRYLFGNFSCSSCPWHVRLQFKYANIRWHNLGPAQIDYFHFFSISSFTIVSSGQNGWCPHWFSGSAAAAVTHAEAGKLSYAIFSSSAFFSIHFAKMLWQ